MSLKSGFKSHRDTSNSSEDYAFQEATMFQIP